ncbi:hypothetical protein PL78_16965 [Yersinia entomophaga]|uniref:Glycoside hydrolase family 42 N-terminal domain-containing protein n=1 Tax=Yersinia entomophaga TaxID=935293 RepID=A0ABM6BQ11_YERET|nr:MULTISPECIES: hypothetical protein [Yersinia]ANI31503.1 hypothetical protein PL78_16965 [Yersinia entomophaga]OWF87855.1 hypothetical protein B4914_09755 [Yersinia entomophaga]
MKLAGNILLHAGLLITLFSYAATGAVPQNFLYTGSDDLTTISSLIQRPDIGGVQIVYNWKALETDKDQYDFSQIERDLAYLNSLNKKLFIQIQDRFFEPQAKNVPAYLMKDPRYNGGIVPQYDNPGENKPAGSGWVTQQWNPAVQQRYQKLLAALATKFDGRVFGVNLPETAIDPDIKRDKSGFSCDKYFAAEMENMAFARKVFSKSHVVQYVNFWPCEWNNDHQYMSRLFEFAAKNKVGLGGPDIVPNKKAQMKNAYPFFNQYKGKLSLVGMAVQEPTLTYTNAKTGKPFTKAEFTDYAENYLGANVIFWSTASPWLSEGTTAR